MYPGTNVNWYDQSQIDQSATITSIENRPMFMVVSSFDKGPEDLREVEAEEFAYLYGKMSFEKHGQNSIQAQNIINAGGKLLVRFTLHKLPVVFQHLLNHTFFPFFSFAVILPTSNQTCHHTSVRV